MSPEWTYSGVDSVTLLTPLFLTFWGIRSIMDFIICNRKEMDVDIMDTKELLQYLDKEQLIQLIEVYSKNLIVMDGIWFQSI